MKTSKIGSFLLLGFLLALGVVLKAWFLNETTIGTDESFSLYTAQHHLHRIIHALSTGDNPPLWEILVHFLIQIFGTKLIAARWLSLIFNVLTVVPIYLIGRKYFSELVGVTASLLYVFSTFSLFMAHEARVYSLLGLLTVSSVYLFLNIIHEPKKLWYYILLSLVNLLIFYSHYLGIWIVVVQFIFIISHPSIRKNIGKKYAAYCLLMLLGIVPWIPSLINRFLASGTHGTWIPTVNGLQDLYFVILKYSNEPLNAVLFIALAFWLIYSSFRKSQTHKTNYTQQLIQWWFWLPLLVSFALSFRVGFFLDRYFYFLLPSLYLIVSISLSQLYSKNRKVSIIGSVIVIVMMAFTFKMSTKDVHFSGYHQDVTPIVSALEDFGPNDSAAVVITPLWFSKDLIYYYDYNMFTTYFDEYDSTSKFRKPLIERHIYPIEDSSEIPTRAYSDILLIDDSNLQSDQSKAILSKLLKHYKEVKHQQYATRNLYYFKRANTPHE
jgi:uncharacterized membrane protein